MIALALSSGCSSEVAARYKRVSESAVFEAGGGKARALFELRGARGPSAAPPSSLAQTISAPTWEQFTSFETYIFDCDGVIWGIDEADTATSVRTINYLIGLGKRVMFITNNSNKRRADFVK